LPSIPPSDDRPSTVSRVCPRYARLLSSITDTGDRELLGNQYSKFSDAERELVDSLLEACEVADTPLDASTLLRFTSRLLHLTAISASLKRAKLRVI